MQLEMFPTSMYLRCCDASLNKQRFYALVVQRNLFGEWELLREWGRIGTLGHARRDFYGSAGEALDALQLHTRSKAKRGYVAL